MKSLTPLHLSLVYHYYTTPGNPENIDSPAAREYAMQLHEEGILQFIPGEKRDSFGSRYQITEKGKFWFDFLLTIPFPVEAYKIVFDTHPFNCGKQI